MLFTHSTLYHHIPSYILLWHTDGTHNLPVPFVLAIVKEKILNGREENYNDKTQEG